MPEELNSFNSTDQNPDNPWSEMDFSAETRNSEPNLADRIRSEMTLEEVSQLDIKNLPEAEFAAVKERLKQFRETGNAGPITTEVDEVVEEKIEKTEKSELSPEVQKLKEKAMNHSGFKGFLGKVANTIKDAANKVAEVVKDPKKLAALGLATMIAAGAGIAGYQIGNNSRSDAETSGTQSEESIGDEFESLTGYDKLDRLVDGSFSQDGNLGCYESEGKVSDTAIGNPDLVLKEMGIDPATATAEERGVVDEYMTYSMKYPAAAQAIAYEIEGFEGLSINEAEDKIANMSDEEKAEFQKELQKIYENSEYSFVDGQGVMENHGVAEVDGVRHSFGVESDLTGVQLIQRTTKLEDGSTVRTYIKEDCNNFIFVIEKENPDGTTTTTTITTDTPSNPENPDIPDAPTPPGGHPAKNEQAERDNAGSRVDQQPLDEAKTPKTTIEQDKKPVQQAHEQVSSGNTAGSSAEKQKQSNVDNSSQTKQNNQESNSHADDSASERANDFAEGNF